MRLAYVVDVHDRPDSVAAALDQIGSVDVLVVGGDITTGGTPDDAEAAITGWQRLAPRLLALAGNMDSLAIDARLDELGVALGGRGYAIEDVGVFGVSAAPTSPLHTPYELDEADLEQRIVEAAASVERCRVLVFCPHAPPAGTACDRLANGQHVGSTAIRAFVEEHQPDVVLCGHIHEARATDTIGRSTIVNPGPVFAGHYAVVEIGDGVHVELDR